MSSQLPRALASLGITLTHSKPGQPAGRGKIERFFRTVRDKILVELGAGCAVAELQVGYLVSSTKRDVRPMRNALIATLGQLTSYEATREGG